MKIAMFVYIILVCCAIAAYGNEDPSTSSPTQENIPPTVTSEAELEPIDFICECAIINTKNPTKSNKVILKQKTINISCDNEGEDKCIKLCTALAKASKDHGPQIICNSLGNYENLKVSLYSRICGSNKWTYTGLTSPNELCCHKHHVIDCKTSVENSPANKI